MADEEDPEPPPLDPLARNPGEGQDPDPMEPEETEEALPEVGAESPPEPEAEPPEPYDLGPGLRREYERDERVRKPRRFGKGFWGRLVLVLLIITVFGPLISVAAMRFIPPPATPLMIINALQGRGIDYRWRSLADMSPALPQAAIAAEDARFCGHHGFDFEAMQRAMASNQKGRKVRGGSTISQQTAKNVFLWPQRSYVRKGLEAWFTVLIEGMWGKRRIMEVYLNVAEWGPGTYGAQAASRRYFRKDAADLTPVEAARLAAILPSPLKWKAAAPGPYVKRRSRRIGGAMGTVRSDGLAGCL